MSRRDKNGGIAKGPARLAVEAVLRYASEPLTTREIAALANLPVGTAATHVANCTTKRLAYNVNPRECPPGAYVWGQPEVEAAPANVVPSRTFVIGGTYSGEAATPTRPGSLEFLTKPSRVGDEIVERKRPLIISGRVEPLGLRG